MKDTEEPTEREVQERATFCLAQAMDYVMKDNPIMAGYWLGEARIEIKLLLKYKELPERKPE